MLDELKEQYPDGMEWGLTSSYTSQTAPAGWKDTCAGFVWMISDALFGTDSQINVVTTHKSLDDVKMGDVLWKKNNQTWYSHAVVVVGVTDKVIYTCSGNMGGKVAWDVTERRVALEAVPELTIYTRY